MKIDLLTFLAALGVIASSFLSAQETPPPVYYGPYQQPSVEQFAGDWTRSDGTYRLVVSVDAAGAVTAEYFNPQPINVESATLTDAEGGLILNVVLRDQGYDGSVYELQYVPQYRVLVGLYTIPGQEPARVSFTK